MKGPSGDLERRLRGLPRAPLSPDLKHRVMMADAPPAADVSWRDRAWFSPAWRLAAACALAALLLADHWSAGMTSHAASAPGRAAGQVERELAGLGEELGMSRDLARRMAVQMVPPTLSTRAPGAEEPGEVIR